MAKSKEDYLHARVDADEYQKFEKAWIAAGMTKSDWVRAAAREKFERDTNTAASPETRRRAAMLAWEAMRVFFEGPLGGVPLPDDLGSTSLHQESLESAAAEVGGWSALNLVFNPPPFGHVFPSNPAGTAARLQHVQTVATIGIAFRTAFAQALPDKATTASIGRPPAWLLSPRGLSQLGLEEEDVKRELVANTNTRLLEALKGDVDDPESDVGKRYAWQQERQRRASVALLRALRRAHPPDG